MPSAAETVCATTDFWNPPCTRRLPPSPGNICIPPYRRKPHSFASGLCVTTPFVDGNKRTGAHAMLVFLALNGIEVDYTQEELVEIILAAASGQCRADGILQWILEHQI